jgi:cyclin-dependent kinase 12/13
MASLFSNSMNRPAKDHPLVVAGDELVTEPFSQQDDVALGGGKEWRSDARWSFMTRTITHYQRLIQIGEGTYGQVYKAKCLHTGREVALKKIRVQHGAYQGFPTAAIREIKIMKKLRHCNMVELLEVLTSKGVEHLDQNDEREEDRRKREKQEAKEKPRDIAAADANVSVENQEKSITVSNSKDKHIDTREGFKGNLFLVLEYVSHDLTGLMDMHYRFSEVQVKSIFRQLLDVLGYIHDNKYVHRDLKCSNILLTSHFELKLADFGLARSIDDAHCMFENDNNSANTIIRTGQPIRQDFTNKVITLWYRPPELLMGETQYGAWVDMWSAGCILAEITLGKPILMGKTEREQLALIFDLVGTPTKETWEGHEDLKLLRSGEMSIGKPRKSQLRKKYEKKGKMGSSAVSLLEKLLELDPTRRITAERALSSRYFLEEPRAPANPADLGTVDLGSGGGNDGHFHEFQTKKRRREAKAAAEKSKQDALAKGMSSNAAEMVYNEAYEAQIRKICEDAKEVSEHLSHDQRRCLGTNSSRAEEIKGQADLTSFINGAGPSSQTSRPLNQILRTDAERDLDVGQSGNKKRTRARSDGREQSALNSGVSRAPERMRERRDRNTPRQKSTRNEKRRTSHSRSHSLSPSSSSVSSSSRETARSPRRSRKSPRSSSPLKSEATQRAHRATQEDLSTSRLQRHPSKVG